MHLLEDCEELHTILSDALMEIGTKAIDNIFSKVNLRLYSNFFLFCWSSSLVESLLYVARFHSHYHSSISQSAKSAEQDFEKLAATESARVGRLLGKLLKKKYPNLHPDIEDITISFDDLLQWHLWPKFIKLYGKLHFIISDFSASIKANYRLFATSSAQKETYFIFNLAMGLYGIILSSHYG